MSPASLIREDGRIGVSFRFGENETAILFATKGKAAGHIRIIASGQKVVDKALTESVTQQTGLTGQSQ